MVPLTLKTETSSLFPVPAQIFLWQIRCSGIHDESEELIWDKTEHSFCHFIFNLEQLHSLHYSVTTLAGSKSRNKRTWWSFLAIATFCASSGWLSLQHLFLSAVPASVHMQMQYADDTHLISILNTNQIENSTIFPWCISPAKQE